MSALPADLVEGVEAALGSRAARVARASPVGGGCIHNATRLELEGAGVAFVKWGARSTTGPGIFRAEAAGLEALASAEALRVPKVLGVFDPSETDVEPERPTAWLLLEWLEPGSAGPDTWTRLGHGLAALHRSGSDRYGADADNFIGTLPQPNGALDDWAAFWRERRLEPQLRLAYGAGHFEPAERRRFDRLLDALGERLADTGAEGASLLHGDLWSGNVHVLANGEPALVDPASYHGHREVDLAMAELFGGFPSAFFHAYDEAWPIDPAYRTVRRPIYQLYYLLVHVNLFGSGYVGSTLRALGEAAP